MYIFRPQKQTDNASFLPDPVLGEYLKDLRRTGYIFYRMGDFLLLICFIQFFPTILDELLRFLQLVALDASGTTDEATAETTRNLIKEWK